MRSQSPPPSEEHESPSLIPTYSNMTRHGKAPATARPDTDDAGETVEHKGRCPFCAISRSFPPVDHLGDPKRIAQILDARKTNPPSQIIYSGESVLAFLDIQPLTWGHTLVIPRRHRVKMGDLGAADGAELGRHLPLISRAVIRAVFDIPYDSEKLEVESADYNIVQNNGPLAAQVVPHIHHHIVPRPADVHPRFNKKGNPAPARLPQMDSKFHASWTMFGRGHRTDLDEDDPGTKQLVQRMRHEIACEFSRGEVQNSYGRKVNHDDEEEGNVGGKKNKNKNRKNNNNNLFSQPTSTGTREPRRKANIPYVSSSSHDSRNTGTANPTGTTTASPTKDVPTPLVATSSTTTTTTIRSRAQPQPQPQPHQGLPTQQPKDISKQESEQRDHSDTTRRGLRSQAANAEDTSVGVEDRTTRHTASEDARSPSARTKGKGKGKGKL